MKEKERRGEKREEVVGIQANNREKCVYERRVKRGLYLRKG